MEWKNFIVRTIMSKREGGSHGTIDIVGAKMAADNILSEINRIKKSEWISVKDRLPEIGTEILAYINAGDIEVRILGNDKVWYDTLLRSTMNIRKIEESVTHWMPLPAAPVGE